jgi:hypothetical protein
MAAPVQACTKKEMRSVIRLFNAEGAKLTDIYTKILAKNGTPCISTTQVYEWVQKYKNEVQIVADPPLSHIHTNMTTLARSFAINICLPSYVCVEILPDDNPNC